MAEPDGARRSFITADLVLVPSPATVTLAESLADSETVSAKVAAAREAAAAGRSRTGGGPGGRGHTLSKA